MPVAKQKHYLVIRVIQPAAPDDPTELVEIEAVLSKAKLVIPWRELQDDSVWRQGWVDLRIPLSFWQYIQARLTAPPISQSTQPALPRLRLRSPSWVGIMLCSATPH